MITNGIKRLGNPRDRFFYRTLTLLIYSYILPKSNSKLDMGKF